MKREKAQRDAERENMYRKRENEISEKVKVL